MRVNFAKLGAQEDGGWKSERERAFSCWFLVVVMEVGKGLEGE